MGDPLYRIVMGDVSCISSSRPVVFKSRRRLTASRCADAFRTCSPLGSAGVGWPGVYLVVMTVLSCCRFLWMARMMSNSSCVASLTPIGP